LPRVEGDRPLERRLRRDALRRPRHPARDRPRRPPRLRPDRRPHRPDPQRRGLAALALLCRPAPLEPRMSTTAYTVVDSPIGEILLTAEDGALTRLYMSPFQLDSGSHDNPAELAQPAV